MNPVLMSRIESLEGECAEVRADPWALAKTYLQLDAEADREITAVKARIFALSRPWGEEERAIALQIRDAAELLAIAGSSIAARCMAENTGGDRERVLHSVLVVALSNNGTAMKWCATARGRSSEGRNARIHALYRMAERLEIARAPEALVREGIARSLTPESHYLRDLLLPLACTGTLDARQLEIADSWLWTWVRDYRLTREAQAGEPGLWVDLGGREGVRLAQFAPDGVDVRFLVISKMRDQIAEVVDGFHAGQVYPGFGLSVDFPAQAHVDLIDHAQAMWDNLSTESPVRAAVREGAERVRIEAFVGLEEILARGFRRGDGDGKLAMDSHPLDRLGFARREPLPANVHEMRHNWVRVQEEHANGLRLAVDDALWERLWQGDLVAIRAQGEACPSLGVVSRKFTAPGSSGARIGVVWIARAPRKVLLRERTAGGGTPQVLPALFAPGDDNCGRFDSVIIPESALGRSPRYELTIAGRTYDIRLNRARDKGRGWVAAGFEVEQARDRYGAKAVA